jgi:uncharacterized membrane protein (DUF485 family)
MNNFLRFLKTFIVISGIQALTSWFGLFVLAALVTGDAETSVISGTVLLSFVTVPVFMSSFVLTCVYNYGIMPQEKL